MSALDQLPLDAPEPLHPRVRRLRNAALIVLAFRARLPIPSEGQIAALQPDATLATLWMGWEAQHARRSVPPGQRPIPPRDPAQRQVALDRPVGVRGLVQRVVQVVDALRSRLRLWRSRGKPSDR